MNPSMRFACSCSIQQHDTALIQIPVTWQNHTLCGGQLISICVGCHMLDTTEVLLAGLGLKRRLGSPSGSHAPQLGPLLLKARTDVMVSCKQSMVLGHMPCQPCTIAWALSSQGQAAGKVYVEQAGHTLIPFLLAVFIMQSSAVRVWIFCTLLAARSYICCCVTSSLAWVAWLTSSHYTLI